MTIGHTPHAAAMALSVLVLTACQTSPVPPTSTALVGEISPGSGYVKGYLERNKLPDSLALLPKPPVDGSPGQTADLAIHHAARTLHATPRWDQAVADNNLMFPKAAESFACILDIAIGAETTPHLTMLLRRSLIDAALATYGAKNHYQRQRPFAALKEATCVPQEEAKLAKDGSFPSGHAALGWAWALILTELAPERADALLQRGHAFGQSRVVCGVHWQSDVDNGRLIGAAVVAQLHANPTFLAQVALAREEIQLSQTSGQKSPLTCSKQ